MNPGLPSLLRAIERKVIVDLFRQLGGQSLEIAPTPRPEFRFGPLLDELPKTLRNEALEEHSRSRKLPLLPFSDCAYSIDRGDSAGFLIILHQESDSIEIELWPFNKGKWFLPVAQATLVPGDEIEYHLWPYADDREILIPTGPMTRGPKTRQEARQEFLEQANMAALLSIFASAILNSTGISMSLAEPDHMAKALNNQLRRAGREALPRARIIHFDRGQTKLVNVRQQPEEGLNGSAISPHDRRAHNRRLNSGRIVRVKACAIHGGADAAPLYHVRQSATTKT